MLQSVNKFRDNCCRCTSVSLHFLINKVSPNGIWLFLYSGFERIFYKSKRWSDSPKRGKVCFYIVVFSNCQSFFFFWKIFISIWIYWWTTWICLNREMMISAHHNRIEQLRESFKKKMEEADAWPGKVSKLATHVSLVFCSVCVWPQLWATGQISLQLYLYSWNVVSNAIAKHSIPFNKLRVQVACCGREGWGSRWRSSQNLNPGGYIWATRRGIVLL